MFDLSLALGYPHPDYLLDDLTGRQLLDWQHYAAQYGSPWRRDDLHWGMSMALTHNINAKSPEGPRTFMPYTLDPLEEDITEEAFIDRIRSRISKAQ